MGAGKSNGPGGNEESSPGHGPIDPSEQQRQPASRAECLAELNRDFAGLEEVCRWQWNLLQRIKQHLEMLEAK